MSVLTSGEAALSDLRVHDGNRSRRLTFCQNYNESVKAKDLALLLFIIPG